MESTHEEEGVRRKKEDSSESFSVFPLAAHVEDK